MYGSMVVRTLMHQCNRVAVLSAPKNTAIQRKTTKKNENFCTLFFPRKMQKKFKNYFPFFFWALFYHWKDFMKRFRFAYIYLYMSMEQCPVATSFFSPKNSPSKCKHIEYDMCVCVCVVKHFVRPLMRARVHSTHLCYFPYNHILWILAKRETAFTDWQYLNKMPHIMFIVWERAMPCWVKRCGVRRFCGVFRCYCCCCCCRCLRSNKFPCHKIQFAKWWLMIWHKDWKFFFIYKKQKEKTWKMANEREEKLNTHHNTSHKQANKQPYDHHHSVGSKAST